MNLSHHATYNTLQPFLVDINGPYTDPTVIYKTVKTKKL